MSATDSHGAPLGEFARAHGLTLDGAPEIPRKGGLLGQDDLGVGAAATGALPGGEPGTVCHLTYTYRSDDTTHTVERTAAVLRVPAAPDQRHRAEARGRGLLARVRPHPRTAP